MTVPINSPKAQEVKLLPCPFCGRQPTMSRIDANGASFYSIDCCVSYREAKRNGVVQFWNTRVTNENQPPLAEKSLLNPNPLSCQSDGNREKELEDALEWMASTSATIDVTFEGDYAVEKLDDIEFVFLGKTPLEAIQSAMKSQDERKGV